MRAARDHLNQLSTWREPGH